MQPMMKRILLALLFLAGTGLSAVAQVPNSSGGCSTCGASSSSTGDNVGVSFHVSLGTTQFGQSAGSLLFSSTLPSTNLFSPAGLTFTASRSDVNVVTNTVGLRQVNAPQALADIVTVNTNSYQIKFYYPSQVGSMSGGVYTLTGSPYMTWSITNSNPSTLNQVQVSQNSPTYGLIHQWNYTYSTSTGIWSLQPLGGAIQQNSTITNQTSSSYQVVNTMQPPSGSVVQQTAKTYQTFSWGVAPVQITQGSGASAQTTTYGYYDPSPYAPLASPPPVRWMTNADGSWQYFSTYDAGGNPTLVYSSFGDVTTNNLSSARATYYYYDTNHVSGSGDIGVVSTNVPRCTIVDVQGQEISRSYTAFPSAYERLDIQCTVAGAAWNAAGNLFTTNYFITNGAFSIRAWSGGLSGPHDDDLQLYQQFRRNLPDQHHRHRPAGFHLHLHRGWNDHPDRGQPIRIFGGHHVGGRQIRDHALAGHPR